jgi:hypothetical protein
MGRRELAAAGGAVAGQQAKLKGIGHRRSLRTE